MKNCFHKRSYLLGLDFPNQIEQRVFSWRSIKVLCCYKSRCVCLIGYYAYSSLMHVYRELGYKAYKVESAEDLKRPFVSMYFGAAYMAWLSEYEGRERSPKFVVQAYLLGPKNVGLNEAGPAWLKFEEELSNYEDIGREQGSCVII